MLSFSFKEGQSTLQTWINKQFLYDLRVQFLVENRSIIMTGPSYKIVKFST
jgi:hypothetical protein